MDGKDINREGNVCVCLCVFVCTGALGVGKYGMFIPLLAGQLRGKYPFVFRSAIINPPSVLNCASAIQN